MKKQLILSYLLVMAAASRADAACITSYSIGGESANLGSGCVIEISKTKNDNFLKVVKDTADGKEVSVYDIDAGKSIALNSVDGDSKSSSDAVGSKNYENDLTGANSQSLVGKAVDTVSSQVSSVVDTILVTLGLRDSVEDRVAAQHSNDPENKVSNMEQNSQSEAEEAYSSLPSDEENQSAIADAAIGHIIDEAIAKDSNSDITEKDERDTYNGDKATADRNEAANITDYDTRTAQNESEVTADGIQPDNNGPDNVGDFGGSDPIYTADNNSGPDSISEGDSESGDSGGSDDSSASAGSYDIGGGSDLIGGAKKFLEEMFGFGD